MGLLYIFGAVIFFIAILAIVGRIRLNRIRRERHGKGFSRERFLEAFREIGIPENIPAAVFDFYGSQKAYRGFSFLPDDEYSKVLCDDPDDIDEDALALLKQLGMVLPPEYILKQRGDGPIKTLRDMILWLDWVRQRQPVAQDNSPAKL